MAAPYKSELRLKIEADFAKGLGVAEIWKKYKSESNCASEFNFYKFVANIRRKWMKEKLGVKMKTGPKPKEQVEIKPGVDKYDKIKQKLKDKKKYSKEELSNYLDTGIGKIDELIVRMKEEGYNVVQMDNSYMLSEIIEKHEPRVMNINKMSSGTYRIGFCGDNHLCSKYERLDILNALYDHYEDNGVAAVYNTGNWIDGEARFNKHDIHVHGLDNQLDYFINKYPQRNNLTTYFITGDDHEGWYTQREGVDVGFICEARARKAGRTDLVYIGHMESDIIFPAENGKTILRVQHPGGGSSYAISYTSQKIVESFSGNEKPDILAIGHYHKAEYIFVRGVHVVQTACTQDQSPFMRKKRLAAHLGGWIIEFSTDSQGAITRFKSEYLPFYDKDYYKKWGYAWG